MGIVIKQSIRSSIIAYIGVLIGYFNLMWLFPYFMSAEQVGLMRLIQVSASLLATFGQVGLPQTIVRFFPEYKEEKSFFSFVRLAGLLGFLVLILLASIFKTPIVNYFSDKSELFVEYFNFTLLITFFLIQFQIMEAFSRSHLKTIFPTFVRDVQLRILTTVIVVLFGLGIISFDGMITILILVYASLVVTMMIFFGREKMLRSGLDFSFLKNGHLKKIGRFGMYSLLGAGGTQIVYQIDSVMVSGNQGLNSTGIYAIGFFIGIVIEMPKRSILQVVMPLISQSFQKRDMAHVKTLYRQSSINQFIIGGLLLLGIWSNIDNVYALIPNKEVYLAGMTVVLYIGLGKLSDMLFGPNGEIIVMSRYYRVNVVLVVFLALATIVLNYLLIPLYGIDGAAIASLVAMLSFNIIKFFFVWARFKIQPFTSKTLIYAGILATAYFINAQIPKSDSIVLDIIIRSGIITLVVLLPTYFLKVSNEFNQLIRQALNRTINRTD